MHDAIFDLVELIKTFQSKNKLSKVFLSTLFKRRKEELDAVVDRAITRLQVNRGFYVLALSFSCFFRADTPAVGLVRVVMVYMDDAHGVGRCGKFA